MFFFNKIKKKKNTEMVAEVVEHKEVKEKLAKSALEKLTEGKDYEQLKDILCQFGYFNLIDENEVEALFKIKTDKGKFYFAAQKGAVVRLNLSEEKFLYTSHLFMSMGQ